AKRQPDLDQAVSRMLALSEATNEVSFTVARGVTRPVWEPDAKGIAVYEVARDLARSLGWELAHESAGGGSDANFTGAMGIASLDGLGACGDGFHTLGEHILLACLKPRAGLIAGLLATLH
ncbi:MAG: M20/M25/M40 family metallo-hydrolase, partial [Pseudomonadota bacterium]